MRRIIAALALLAASVPPVAAQPDLSRLQTALDAVPVGGWASVSLGTWGSAWPSPRYDGDIGSIAYAWGSMAWDSQRGRLMLWGGGHANYAGNEMYLWDAASGLWSRGSLPSAYQSGTSWIVGNGAPQSSHTYDNTAYLPIADRYVTFGGAAWNSGSNFDSPAGREGPWLWNPALADPNRVGGQDFTGLNAAALGSNAWQSRRGSITGTLPPTFVDAASGYRVEGGKDVMYLAADTGASGFPRLYRYEFNPGGNDIVQQVGVMGPGQTAYQGTATIDLQRGWMVRTIWGGGPSNDLAVWDLDANNPGNPGANQSVGVRLVRPDGTPFDIVTAGGAGSSSGLEFSPNTGTYFLFRNAQITEIVPGVNPDGSPMTTWTAIDRPCASAVCGNSTGQGVHGHWIAVPELGAMMAIGTYNGTTRDVDVLLYKVVAEVPEPGTWMQLAAGLAVLGGVAARRRIGSA